MAPLREDVAKGGIMKSYTKYLSINAKERFQIINITSDVAGAVRASGVQ